MDTTEDQFQCLDEPVPPETSPVPDDSDSKDSKDSEPTVLIGHLDSELEGSTSPVVDFLSRLEVTRPGVLRGVPAFQVLRSFGRVFRGQWEPEALYELGRETKSIDEFWSHSWHGPQIWKIWMFLMIKNGLAACLVGSFVACIMAFLSFMHYLPGSQKVSVRASPDFDGERLAEFVACVSRTINDSINSEVIQVWEIPGQRPRISNKTDVVPRTLRSREDVSFDA